MPITEYYCDPDNGDDANDGLSEINAWEDIQTAVNNIGQWDRLNVKKTSSRLTYNGGFTVNNINDGTKIIRGYETSIDDGEMFEIAIGAGIISLTGRNIIFENFDITCAGTFGIPNVGINSTANGSLIYRCKCENTYSTAVSDFAPLLNGYTTQAGTFSNCSVINSNFFSSGLENDSQGQAANTLLLEENVLLYGSLVKSAHFGAIVNQDATSDELFMIDRCIFDGNGSATQCAVSMIQPIDSIIQSNVRITNSTFYNWQGSSPTWTGGNAPEGAAVIFSQNGVNSVGRGQVLVMNNLFEDYNDIVYIDNNDLLQTSAGADYGVYVLDNAYYNLGGNNPIEGDGESSINNMLLSGEPLNDPENDNFTLNTNAAGNNVVGSGLPRDFDLDKTNDNYLDLGALQVATGVGTDLFTGMFSIRTMG